MNNELKALNDALSVAVGMYANEPCRICGKLLEVSDLDTAVFAGYSEDSKSRAAHKVCWEARPPQSKWAYPA
jgi:hypothetical protein